MKTKPRSLNNYLQLVNHAARWAGPSHVTAPPALRPYVKRVPRTGDRGFWLGEVLDDLRRDAERDLSAAEMKRFNSVVQIATAPPPPGHGRAHAKKLDREIASSLASASGPKLTQAQRAVLGNIIARGGVSEHDLHMGRMERGDVRKSVANKLVQMGLVTIEPLWTDVHYRRTRLLPAQTYHHRVNHYYATTAGYAAYGSEPARLT
jgi:hypothetical protein